jgi:hypothetical protein
LRYLLNSEKYPLKAEFKRRSPNASTKEQLYAAMLAEKLSPKHRGKQDVLLHHLNGRCALLDGDYYRDNPFFKTIKISEWSIGTGAWLLIGMRPIQAFAFRDRCLLSGI